MARLQIIDVGIEMWLFGRLRWNACPQSARAALPDDQRQKSLNRSGPGGWLQRRSYVRVARQAGLALAVSASTVLRMIRAGILPANQLCKGAPWIIRHCDLERDDVRREAMARRARRPVSCDPLQQTLDL
jgi:hypothetical protein